MNQKSTQYVLAEKTGNLLAEKNTIIEQQAARIKELEAVLTKIVEKCEYCEEGYFEYQPSGIDGYLPTGDARFVTEPCWNCSEARSALSSVQS